MLVTSLCFLIFSSTISVVTGNINSDDALILPAADIIEKPEENTIANVQEIHCNCDIEANDKFEELEHEINGRMNKLEYNIQHRLEKYINRKLNTLENSIPEKLEQNLNLKFHTLKNNMASLEENIIRKFEEALNKITYKPVVEENIKENFNVIEKRIPDIEAINVNDKPDAFEKKVSNKSESHKTSDRFKNNTVYNFEAILDTKLKVLSREVKIMTEELEKNIDRRLDLLNISIPDQDRSISPTLDRMENNLIQLQNNITQKCMDTRAKEKLCIETQYMHCKEFSERNSGAHKIDDLPFNYTTVKRNSTGHLTHFKMHFAVMGSGNSILQLSITDKKENNKTYEITLVAEVDDQYTPLKSDSLYAVVLIDTPNIVSSTEFRAFYITIVNGTLEFGKEGDIPIISHANPAFSSFNYIRLFSIGGQSPSKFLYDCPECNLYV